MAKNVIEIIIKADGSGVVSGTEQAAKSIGGLGSSIGTMAAVAGGALIAGAISSMGNFFKTIAGGALSAVGNAQNLEIALEGLLTQSLMYDQVTSKIQTANVATAEQTQRIQDLRLQQQMQSAQMQEQRQRIIELTAAYGENGLNVDTARARLAQMENTATKTANEIATLEAATSGYSTTTKMSWEQVMNLADAQGLAKEQSADLLKGVKALAIVSPFETTQIENMTKLGIAAGLTADEVLGFTEAFMGISAVAGVENIEFAAGQFLQMQKIGKMTTIDLRQLRNMGIDVERMLGTQLGMTVEEFNKEAEKSPEIWKELNNALVSFANETGAVGALDRMSGTVTGMMSTMSDVVEIGSRDFFRPIVEAASPFVSELVGVLSDMVTGGAFTQIGQQIGDSIANVLSGNFFAAMQSLNIPPEIALTISDVANAIIGIVEGTRDFKGLLIALGLGPESIAMILDIKDYIEGIVDAATGGGFYDILAAMGFSGSNITAVYEISGSLSDIWTVISTNLIPSSETMGSLWQDTLYPAIIAVGDYINANLLPFMADLAALIGEFVAALMPELSAMWEQIKTEFESSQPALDELWASFQKLAEAFGFDTQEGDALDVVLGAIKITLDLMLASVQSIEPSISILGETISYVAGVVSGFLEDTMALVNAFTSLTDTSTSLVERLGNLGSAFLGFTIPDELIPGSPTPFETGLVGISDTIQGMLQPIFSSFWAILTELTNAYIAGPLLIFETHLQTLITVTVPMLQSMYITAMGAMSSATAPVNDLLAQMATLFTQAANAASSAAEEIVAAMKSIENRIGDAVTKLRNQLVPAIMEAVEAFHKMADAAAAAAAGSSHAGSTAPEGQGFQHGTGGVRTVPAGFNNDSFRAMLSSGEQFAVAPRGVNLRDMLGLGGGGTVINMTNNITTQQPVQDILHSLEIAKAMIPA